jgi:ABC-type molybdate transport system substrate-binding protein
MFKQHSLSSFVGAAGLALVLIAGTVGVATGSAVAAPTGTTFLAASNTEPAFDFMTQDFVQSANGGNSVTFSFGGSGHLAGEIDGGVDFASDGSGNSPAGFALFASADEANVDNTIPEGVAAAKNAGAVEKNSVGQCVDPHSTSYSADNGNNNNGTSCPGIGSTRAQYTTGRLVIFSCRSGGQTLAPAQGAPTCAEPVSGFFAKSGKKEAPSTMSQVWSDLLAHTNRARGGSARQNVGGYLAIADPKNGWDFADTGCGPSAVAPNAPYGLAGMESLYVAAVEYYHAHPHAGLGASASDQACTEIDRMTDKGSSLDNFNTTSPSSGGQAGNGNYSDPSLPIIFGDNVTYTQDTVVAGTSQIALIPKSFVFSPAGNDTDFWAEVPECGVANIADASPSNGWSTHISNAESCTDRNYVAGMNDNTASKISSRNFGAASPKTLVGQHGYYQPIRQWVVVENDDPGQSAAADLASADGISAQAFITYLLSAKGQAVLASFGYDPIS